MKINEPQYDCEREFDFALIVDGISEMNSEIEDALFTAGCDDATLTMSHGLMYIEFSRTAKSLQSAILSAIHDIHSANINAQILRIDECDLVTKAEIARKINRSRQLVHQYITGERGPGHFPPPECYINDDRPLWAWCSVSYWLVQNEMLRPEETWNAHVISSINNRLESQRQFASIPNLVKQIQFELKIQP